MKNFKQIAGYAISAAFLFYLFTRLDLDKLRPVARSLKWEYFFAAIFINCISYFIHALRWKKFFPEARAGLSLVFRSVVIGHMFNTILPSKAGELIRPLFLQRVTGIPYTTILSTCLVERILDGLLVLGLLALGTWGIGSGDFGLEAGVAMGSLYILAAGFVAMASYKSDWIKAPIEHLAPKGRMSAKLNELINDFSQGASRLMPLKRFRGILLFTSMYWFLNVWAIWLLIQGLPMSETLQTPYAAMLIVGALGIALTLPSAPANIGVYHYAVYYALVFLTENTEGTLGNSGVFIAASVLIHLAAVAPDLIIGAASYYTFPKKRRPDPKDINKAA